MKAAFLDRDGTIIRDYPDAGWAEVDAPEFLPGALQALRIIRDKGYSIVVISNQYLINDGIITLNQFHALNSIFIEALCEAGAPPLSVYFCPHSKRENCGCMKPKPGMMLRALEEYPSIDLSNSFIAGDSQCDEDLAQELKLPFYRVCKGHSLLDIANSL